MTDAELQAFATQRLGELAKVLEPLCGPDCRSLPARPDPELNPPLRLQQHGPSRSEFVVLYQPDEFRQMLAYSEALATQGLAHEMGHYIDIAIAGANLDDPWRLEIGADVVAGCAFELLGLRLELVRAVIVATAAPEDSIDARLELVCGSDSKHPAARWRLEAFDIGARLCYDGIVALERLETEAADLARDSRRAAEKARTWFPPFSDPCHLPRVD